MSLLPRTTPPVPRLRVDVDAGPGVRGLVVRAVLLVAALALAVAGFWPVAALPAVPWTLGVVAAGLVTGFPRSAAPHLLVAAVGVALLSTTGPFDPFALVLVLLAHLVLRLAWWAAHVPPSGHVELRAVLPDARRFVVIQIAVQVAGVVLLVVSGGPGLPLVAAAGGVALLATTLLVLPRD